MHPLFPDLLGYAAGVGLDVEVYTNLTHVRDSWWELFARYGASLATSYYSDSAAEHDGVTGRCGSHARTLANIKKAVSRGIPLRAGIIEVSDGQRTDQARAELESLGVEDIGIDRLRRVGRGAGLRRDDLGQLCGRCGDGCLAIGADGTVWPCVFSRWLPVGNVRTMRVAGVLAGPALRETMTNLAVAFSPEWPCAPKMCDPQCGPSCSPRLQSAKVRADLPPAVLEEAVPADQELQPQRLPSHQARPMQTEQVTAEGTGCGWF